MSANFIFVCGFLASGKDTFCDKLTNHEHIRVGDIVREILQDPSRQQLIHLASIITGRLTDIIDNSIALKCPIVINGIRQLSILRSILKHLDDRKQLYEVVWLDVDPIELKRRYIERADNKDSELSFEEAFSRDLDLGIREVEVYIKEREPSKFFIINHN